MRLLSLILLVACTEPVADTGDTGTSDTGVTDTGVTDTGDTGVDTDTADTGGDTGDLDPCALPVGAPPVELGLDPFYTRYLDVGGMPVIGSDQVDAPAFAVVCEVASHMLSARPDVHAELVANGGKLGIMASTEVTTDLPEHSQLYDLYPNSDWDRFRGIGGTLAIPLTSCAEENVLHLAGDIYAGESILVHEFAHGIYNLGVAPLGGDFPSRLQAAYDDALANGRFLDTYADNTMAEYWAEGVQSWFDANAESVPPNGVHNHVNTREELQAYDPALAALIAEVFPDDAWTVP
ncbi:MAG: hypothetical protein EP330_22730 [Deltaproteobacteria bacterium]|nr:MAG: hypothetical protein EP330_22730 [Deltaproteobacteria bacterium]